jgi:hypothetical protein
MEVATLGRAALLIALTSACHAVANGAEIQTLEISSAPRVLEPQEVFTGGQTHVGPNGEAITTVISSDWKQETEPFEVTNDFNAGHPLPPSCSPQPSPSADDGETFFGTNREVAKTHLAKSPVEEANLTVKGYLASLPSDAHMHELKISIRCDTDRVDVEKRYVTVAAYLIAVLKEKDNDYHLILEDKDCKDPSCRLTVEISGIPRLNGSQAVLKAARQSFEKQLRGWKPPIEVPQVGGLSLPEPVLVRVTGWAFYDSDHPIDPNTGIAPVGPPGHHPGSAWEVHPVTSFELGPQGEVSSFALTHRAHND